MLNHSFLHSTAHAQEGKGKHNAITSLQGSLVFGIRISEDKMGNTTCKGRRWAEKQPTVPSGAAEHPDMHHVSTKQCMAWLDDGRHLGQPPNLHLCALRHGPC